MCQRKQARRRGCAYAARARLGQGLTSGCISTTKETVALTQPDCSPSKGMDWEEVTLTAPLLRGTLWITVAVLFLPSSGRSEKLTLRTLSLSWLLEQEKTLFSWNGWARTVEVLTFCCFCLGKHGMIPRLIHSVHRWQVSGQWHWLWVFVWLCFPRRPIEQSMQLSS